MTSGKRILLVDDDVVLRRSLGEQLAAEGFVVSEAATAAEAEAQIGGPFDLVLLDVGLPDADGRVLCRRLRDGGVTVPIIMLTAADSEADTIEGLDSGANDYVAKPFRLGILLARLRSHLRQHEHSDDASFTIGPFTFLPAAKLLVDGQRRKIRLTEKETAILKYLFRAGDRVVGRDVLLGEVWGYNPAVTTHTLETHVYRLRQKIEEDPGRARILVTEPGGYRLVP